MIQTRLMMGGRGCKQGKRHKSTVRWCTSEVSRNASTEKEQGSRNLAAEGMRITLQLETAGDRLHRAGIDNSEGVRKRWMKEGPFEIMLRNSMCYTLESY